MNRLEILKFMTKQLDKIGATYPIFEIVLNPDNTSELSVERTVLIDASANTTIEEIKEFCNTFGLSLHENDIRKYSSETDLLKSDLIPTNSLSNTVNWRGRLLEWSSLKVIKEPELFKERLLNSYWRLLVTKNEEDYFVRFEIGPCYYNPGHSTAGSPEIKVPVQRFLEYLISLRERWQLDLKHDRIVVFTRTEPEKTFQRSKLDFSTQDNYISAEEVLYLIKKSDINDITSKLCKNIYSRFS